MVIHNTYKLINIIHEQFIDSILIFWKISKKLKLLIMCLYSPNKCSEYVTVKIYTTI